jgi:hypothetical protein
MAIELTVGRRSRHHPWGFVPSFRAGRLTSVHPRDPLRRRPLSYRCRRTGASEATGCRPSLRDAGAANARGSRFGAPAHRNRAKRHELAPGTFLQSWLTFTTSHGQLVRQVRQGGAKIPGCSSFLAASDCLFCSGLTPFDSGHADGLYCATPSTIV